MIEYGKKEEALDGIKELARRIGYGEISDLLKF